METINFGIPNKEINANNTKLILEWRIKLCINPLILRLLFHNGIFLSLCNTKYQPRRINSSRDNLFVRRD